jgi:hypothetical protein
MDPVPFDGAEKKHTDSPKAMKKDQKRSLKA